MKNISNWQRHSIDTLPERSMFILAGDLDGDGLKDLAAGGWWWKNPGNISDVWQRQTIGDPLHNMAIIYDFDKDGDLDILGTQGVGSEANNNFLWACNNGSGVVTIFDNIDYSDGGDFLQGCTMLPLKDKMCVALSWHRDGDGIQALEVPSDPSETTWTSWQISPDMSDPPQGEDLSTGDIDGDGKNDLLLGMKWLKNQDSSWTTNIMGHITDLDSIGEADRNDLADINGDGRPDVVVGLENGIHIVWFEAPPDPTQPWKRHIISQVQGQGFSMDTADFDNDGDLDVVVGEHRGNTENRVILYENQNGGTNWKQHIVDAGPNTEIDHHDGTQAVDIDGDGYLDIISIGWYNPKVWIFENKN